MFKDWELRMLSSIKHTKYSKQVIVITNTEFVLQFIVIFKLCLFLSPQYERRLNCLILFQKWNNEN